VCWWYGIRTVVACDRRTTHGVTQVQTLYDNVGNYIRAKTAIFNHAKFSNK